MPETVRRHAWITPIAESAAAAADQTAARVNCRSMTRAIIAAQSIEVSNAPWPSESNPDNANSPLRWPTTPSSELPAARRHDVGYPGGPLRHNRHQAERDGNDLLAWNLGERLPNCNQAEPDNDWSRNCQLDDTENQWK